MSLEWHRVKNSEPFPDAYYAYVEPLPSSARVSPRMVVAPIGKRWGLFHVVEGAPLWCLSEWRTVRAAKEAGDAWVDNRKAIDAATAKP
jgi:hypothetical protein